jgi:beta-galactosidase/beta-glucuronidase
MKKTLLSSLLFLGMALTVCAEGAGFGRQVLLNDGWQFRLEPEIEWRRVMLPHDWSVEYAPSDTLYSCTGYLPGGVGHYRRVFAPGELTAERETFLYFEGIYNRSEVLLNGHPVGGRPNGYISFLCELTPYMKAEGENVVEVRVDHSRQADSRWYTGSGIWRDVWLVTAGPLRLAQWGVTYELLSVEADEATLRTAAEVVVPKGKEHCSVTFRLEDADGRRVATERVKVKDGKAETVLHVPAAKRWDIDNPYLYTLHTVLTDDGSDGVVADQTACRVGLRTLRFDADEGFFLNGVNRKVKGVCLHHDAGVLGAAVPEEVWRWRLYQLRELGCNAIRCSHNPQAPVLYDLCDELGFLVIDEASDEWEFPKRKWLEGWNKGKPGYEGSYDFFEEWIDRDVADMVRRDRRHPSVFLWSIGNEVDYPNDPYSHPVLDGSSINQPMYGGFKADAPRAERIGEIAKRLSAVVRANDTSRPVTGALAGVVMSNETDYPEAVDVVGYNYTENRYAQDHATYPERVIYGSENSHGYEQWLAVRDNPYIFGQFLWTGIDYLGESGAWPSRGLGTGLLDFCGFPKGQGMMRKAMWAQQPGDTLDVRSMSPRGGRRGFPRNDRSRDAEALPAPTMLRLTVLNDSLPIIDHRAAGHPRTLLVLVELTDDEGTLLRHGTQKITCTVEGEGARLLGLESGSNTDMSAPYLPHRSAWGGRILAYIQLNERTGNEPMRICFSADGLSDAVLTIR